ncbi:hypothetical protein D3C85_1857250 [compost metagenome]
MTKTFAGGTVPAAVIISGKPRVNSFAASITARYPARFAWLDKTSIVCARVMRGTSSIDMATSPCAA